MSTYHPTQSSNYWLLALKILILILGLSLSALVLSKVFTFIFAIAFFLIRIVVVLTVSFIILHVFLKLLFQIDMIKYLFGKQFIFRKF